VLRFMPGMVRYGRHKPMIEVRPLSQHVGVEVRGVDVRSLADDDFAAMYRAWLDHNVLVVPDQKLEIDQFLAYSRRFGALQPHPSVSTRHPQYPELTMLGVDKWNPDGTLNKDQVARELADALTLQRHLSEIYSEVSSGRVSKPFTLPSVVTEMFHEALTEAADEAINDLVAKLAERQAGPYSTQEIVESIRQITGCTGGKDVQQ